jgi:hypothetical protein
VADDIWIKRIVETATHPIDSQSIMDAIAKCDGRKFELEIRVVQRSGKSELSHSLLGGDK